MIDDGKVEFDSDERMGIWVREVDDRNGFILLYKPEANSEQLKEVRYKYQHGQFVIEEGSNYYQLWV